VLPIFHSFSFHRPQVKIKNTSSRRNIT